MATQPDDIAMEYLPINQRKIVGGKKYRIKLYTYVKNAVEYMFETGAVELDSANSDVINEATAGAGVTVDGVLLKDGIVAFPASMVSIMAAAGSNAATATQLTGKFSSITSGTGGVALHASPLYGQEVYVSNTTGVTISIYGNVANGSIMSVGNGWGSFTSSVTIKHTEIYRFINVSGQWFGELVVGPSGTLSLDTINERTGTAGVTIDSVLLKDGLVKTGAGAVGLVAVKVNADGTGFYEVSATQLGIAIQGVLKAMIDNNGLVSDVISEQTSTVGVTIDGALIKDGAFTGKQATATATADGLTTGALTGADQFVTVTSALADDVICLPAEATTPIGTVIRGVVGANGFELRPIAAEAATTTINGVTTSVEAAIPANTTFRVEKVLANTWILTATDNLGAVVTAIIPDAI